MKKSSTFWSRMTKVPVIAGLAAALSVSTFAGNTSNPKIASDLQSVSGTQTVDVLVQYNSGVTSSACTGPQGCSPSDLTSTVGDALASLGGTVLSVEDNLNLVRVMLAANKLDKLAADPSVLYVSMNRPVQMLSTPTDFYNDAVNASYAWNLGYDGTGVGIAVIDSGIADGGDLHDAATGLNSRIVYSHSFVPWTWSANDEYGHGTHVAGILAGNGNNSKGPDYTKNFKGIAPNANLINLRVLDAFGSGTDAEVISAINRAISLRRKYNIRVINLSLGRPISESYVQDPLCQAVEKAYRAGIVVVVAAGNNGRDNSFNNNGYGTILSPANDPYVITVGAMKPMGTPDRSDDLIASYSSKGPSVIDGVVKPDIVAPGNQVISLLGGMTLPALLPTNHVANSYYHPGVDGLSTAYFTLSGTSMAAPVVSGAAALMLQKDPSLSPDQVKARMMKTASKNFPQFSSTTDPYTGITYTSQYDVFTIGAGYLDAQAALMSTEASSGKMKSPTATYDAASDAVYFASDAESVWGKSNPGSGSWSTSAIWGGNVFGNSQPASASSAFASAALSGQTAAWGQATVWQDPTTTPTTTVSADSKSAVWGQSKSAVWGQGTVSGQSKSAVWGQTTVSSQSKSAVWGQAGISAQSKSAVWGQSLLVQGEK